jgi:hypothetical protein
VAPRRGNAASGEVAGDGIRRCYAARLNLGYNQAAARASAAALCLQEREQIGVDRLCLRCWHAVWEVLVGLERPVLQQAGSITKCNTFLAGCCDGNQLRAFDRGAY